MRISDWSSDVCSSDLDAAVGRAVDVHVEDGQEDADLLPGSPLGNDLGLAGTGVHHLAVGRGDDGVLVDGRTVDAADRVAEERDEARGEGEQAGRGATVAGGQGDDARDGAERGGEGRA